MGLILGLLFRDCHATFRASVSALALALLMLNYPLSLNHFPAVNARHFYERANSLMPPYLLTNTLGLTILESLALDWRKFTLVIMCGYLLVRQHLRAPHCVVSTLELHLL